MIFCPLHGCTLWGFIVLLTLGWSRMIVNVDTIKYIIKFDAGIANIYNAPFSLIVIKKHQEPATIILRYCWFESLSDVGCDLLLNGTESMIKIFDQLTVLNPQTTNGWQSFCYLLNQIGKSDCASVARYIYVVPEVVSPYEKYLQGYADGFSDIHVNYIVKLASQLYSRGCINQQASDSLRTYLSTEISSGELKLWLHPSFGIWRSRDKVFVPCDDANWMSGKWHPRPMWFHDNQEISLIRCSTNVVEIPNELCASRFDGLLQRCKSNWNYYCPDTFLNDSVLSSPQKPQNSKIGIDSKSNISDPDLSASEVPVLVRDFHRRQCVVISFVSRQLVSANENNRSENHSSTEVPTLAYELSMSSQFHCHVHVFYQSHSLFLTGMWEELEGLHFHEVDSFHQKDSSFSDLLSSLVSTIRWEQENMRDYPVIDILKLDCNGLEWIMLHDLVSHPNGQQSIVHRIQNIHVRLNFGRPSIDTFLDLIKVSEVWERLVIEGVFKLWYLHHVPVNSRNIENPSSMLHRLLLTAGVDPAFSSVDLGLQNMAFSMPTLNNSKIFSHSQCNHHSNFSYPSQCASQGCTFMDQRPSSIRHEREQAQQRRGVVSTSMTILGYPNSDIFSDQYKEIHRRNLTVAVVQFSPIIHSEMLSPLVNLLKASGVRRIIVYFDMFYTHHPSHRYSMVRYMKGWRDWDIRHPRRCLEESQEWDYLVMATADEFMYSGHYFLNLTVPLADLLQEYYGRVIGIQHHQFRVTPSLYSRELLLTPLLGRRKWFFPIIDPELNKADDNDDDDDDDDDDRDSIISNSRQIVTSGRNILLLGSVDKKSGITDMEKSKDVADLERYLAKDNQNKLIAINRKADDFEELMELFPDQTMAFRDVDMDLYSQIIQSADFIWIPVMKESLYTRGVFSSTLSVALGFRKIVIAPRIFFDFYEIGDDIAVIYNQSILEIDFNKIHRKDKLQKLATWVHARRIENSINFMTCLLTSCD